MDNHGDPLWFDRLDYESQVAFMGLLQAESEERSGKPKSAPQEPQVRTVPTTIDRPVHIEQGAWDAYLAFCGSD